VGWHLKPERQSVSSELSAEVAMDSLWTGAAALVKRVRRRLRSPEDAEDAVQEVARKLCQLGSIGTIEKLDNYLSRAVSNEVKDRGKRAKVQAGAMELLVRSSDLDACHPSPEETCDADEQLARLGRAVDTLPDDCRIALILVNHEGLSVSEAARRMGKDRRTVAALIQRAIEHCRRSLELTK
jgi:RNA polymerase sigma factor (sigma-70 family)